MKLHNDDAVTLVELWAGIKNYVPAKEQKQAAEQYLSGLDDSGLVDLSLYGREMYGVCDVFDSVLRTYCEENGYNESLACNDEWQD